MLKRKETNNSTEPKVKSTKKKFGIGAGATILAVTQKVVKSALLSWIIDQLVEYAKILRDTLA